LNEPPAFLAQSGISEKTWPPDCVHVPGIRAWRILQPELPILNTATSAKILVLQRLSAETWFVSTANLIPKRP
jgi:hypothetical protein